MFFQFQIKLEIVLRSASDIPSPLNPTTLSRHMPKPICKNKIVLDDYQARLGIDFNLLTVELVIQNKNIWLKKRFAIYLIELLMLFICVSLSNSKNNITDV